MNWALGRAVGVRFAAALVVLCTIGTISIWSTLRFVHAAHARRTSYELRDRLSMLSADLQDAETGQRGYLLTGREPYLRPFLAGRVAVTHDLAALRVLTGADSLEASQLAALEPLIDAKIMELTRTVDLRRRGGLAAALAVVATDSGQQLMDRIRRATARMNAIETARTVRSDSEVRTAGTLALTVGAGGTALAVIFVLAAVAEIGRGMSSKDRAEAALRIAEARLQRVTSSSTAVLYAGTFKGDAFTPTWVSDNIVRMMGYATDETLDPKWWLDRVHPEDRDRVLGEMAVLLASGQLALEYRFQPKHGDWRWVRDEARLVRDDHGAPAELFGSWVDVTERHVAEEALRRYAAELETANAELDAFSYSVSHDLRAPLRSIDGFSQALLEDSAEHLDDTGRGHIDRIRAAAKRMAKLIDDLLELSRVTRADLNRERVDLSGLAQEVMSELSRVEPDRDVTWTIVPGLVGDGDPQLLRVVLENLLGNAWKYTAKRAQAHIEFGLERSNGTDAYYVRDNGAGFDMAYAGKLFGAFQRLHAEGDFRGTGIGLATVQRIIHRHGGGTWGKGAVGKGASFYFTL